MLPIVPTMATFPIYRFCFPFRSYFYERWLRLFSTRKHIVV